MTNPTTTARAVTYGDQVTYTDTGVTFTFTAAADATAPTALRTVTIAIAGRPGKPLTIQEDTPVTVVRDTLPPEPQHPGTMRHFTYEGKNLTAVRTFHTEHPWMLNDDAATTLTWADLIALYGPTTD